MAKKTYTLFQSLISKDGKTTYVKPKLGKYGVKSITVELNDGTVVDLNEQSTLFPQDPRAPIDKLVANGTLSEEEAAVRKERIAFIKGELTLSVES